MTAQCYGLLVLMVVLPQLMVALWPGLDYCPKCKVARKVQGKKPCDL